jgi:hypothetical protein
MNMGETDKLLIGTDQAPQLLCVLRKAALLRRNMTVDGLLQRHVYVVVKALQGPLFHRKIHSQYR